MKNRLIFIDEKEVCKKARGYLVRFCAGDKRMLEQAMNIRKSGLEGVGIKAVVSSYGRDVYSGGKIEIGGSIFTCKAFERIKDRTVKAVYIYLLTAGECLFSEDDNIMDKLLADIWGTAYVEAAADLLKTYIIKEIENIHPDSLGNSLYLSDKFGPGLYGMDIKQSIDFFKVLNAQKLGISVKESGVIVPPKSCVGLFLVVTDPRALPMRSCADCVGNAAGCNFCKLSYE